MGFGSIIRKLSTSLLRIGLSMLLILMLFLHFWNQTPEKYVSEVIEDVYEHADPVATEAFEEKILSVCDTVEGGSVTSSLLDSVLDTGEQGEAITGTVSIITSLCTDDETLAEARDECDWLKSYPTARRFPMGMESMFESVDELRATCAMIESGEFEQACRPADTLMEDTPVGDILNTIEEACSYSEGESDEDAAKAIITGIAASAVGQDMGSMGELLPEDVQDPSAKRALSILDTALTLFSKLKESLAIHAGAIIMLILLIALINLRHLDYAIKKVSMGMIGPTVSILLPFTVLQLYIIFVEVDTTPFFIALQGATQFTANIGQVITSILPFLFLRTYTMSLIIAALSLAVLGLLVRTVGMAAFKAVKGEEKEEEKGKDEKEGKEKKAGDKDKGTKPDEKAKDTKKEELAVPKPKEKAEDKPKEKGKPEDSALKEKTGEKKKDKPKKGK